MPGPRSELCVETRLNTLKNHKKNFVFNVKLSRLKSIMDGGAERRFETKPKFGFKYKCTSYFG